MVQRLLNGDDHRPGDLCPEIPTLTALPSTRGLPGPGRQEALRHRPDIEPLLSKLAEDAKARDAEVVTIFYGEDVTEEDARRLRPSLPAHVLTQRSVCWPVGSAVYYYVVSIE